MLVPPEILTLAHNQHAQEYGSFEQLGSMAECRNPLLVCSSQHSSNPNLKEKIEKREILVKYSTAIHPVFYFFSHHPF